MTDADWGTPFLTAEWRWLAMLNYEIDPAVLHPWVPKGTELDAWGGKTWISMVGFLFLNTRVMAVPIPYHRNFEEINLRFYVRRKAAEGWRRGVVFVKEIVPRAAIAWAARWLYNEDYLALPTGNEIRRAPADPAAIESVKYFWRFNNELHFLELSARGAANPLVEGSAEEFITEHYWGYAAQRDGGTVEYRVEHPAWRVRQAHSCRLVCAAEKLYGAVFGPALSRSPASAFLAEGSAIKVYRGKRLT